MSRRDDASERLVDFAQNVKRSGPKREVDLNWRESTVEECVQHALAEGIVDFIEAVVDEARLKYPRPLNVSEGPIMDGMRVVRDLFGSGRMFLPQVVKSARVMMRGVAPSPLAWRKTGPSAATVGPRLYYCCENDIGHNWQPEDLAKRNKADSEGWEVVKQLVGPDGVNGDVLCFKRQAPCSEEGHVPMACGSGSTAINPLDVQRPRQDVGR